MSGKHGPAVILGRDVPTLSAKKRLDGSLELHIDPTWDAPSLFAVGSLINRAGNALLDELEFANAMGANQPPQEEPTKLS